MLPRAPLKCGGLVAFMLTACHAPSPAGYDRSEADLAHIYRHDQSWNQGPPPHPEFTPITPRYAVRRSGLRRQGEVLLIEGDSETVATSSRGFGITEANEQEIVRRVLEIYPDAFDTIQIYTTFFDANHPDTAYYRALQNDVEGLGIRRFNNRPSWNLPTNGRLSGFSNMNTMYLWGRGSLTGLNEIRGFYHGVIAHELSHRWLFRLEIPGATDEERQVLLGRQRAHWSSLAQAYGSVHDGNFWRDEGETSDGRRFFRNQGTDLGFSPLELYAMGHRPPDQVEDFFHIQNATTPSGQPVFRESSIDPGTVILGQAIKVTIDDVLSEMGPRNPPYRTVTPYHNVAFVLVTAPGEPESAWGPHLEVLQNVQKDFPESWNSWTGGVICTTVAERCDQPIFVLTDHIVEDGGDNFASPGETVGVRLFVGNEGPGLARNVVVRLEATDDFARVVTPSNITVPSIEEDTSVSLSEPFRVEISSDAPCAEAATLRASFTSMQGLEFQSTLSIPIGSVQVHFDPLDEATGWQVDPDGSDTATEGTWEFGDPEAVTLAGVVMQPEDDHTPGESKFAFHTALNGDRLRSDVDGGKTTLVSPTLDLSTTQDPQLVFYGWHVALDFLAVPRRPVDGADLIVEVTNNGGQDWEELGRITEQTEAWTRYHFRIQDRVTPSRQMRFRWTISDPSGGGNVEAGVDDLEIVELAPVCAPQNPPDAGVPMAQDAGMRAPSPDKGEGGGCRTTGWGAGLLWLGLGGFLFALRRRRR